MQAEGQLRGGRGGWGAQRGVNKERPIEEDMYAAVVEGLAVGGDSVSPVPALPLWSSVTSIYLLALSTPQCPGPRKQGQPLKGCREA